MIPLWVATRHVEPLRSSQPERVVVEIHQQSARPSQPRQAEPAEENIAPPALTLDNILNALERNHQRATFGAVGGILNRDPRSLFNGYVRTPRTAWVVNRFTGLPTGTKESEYPPGLLEKEKVIDVARRTSCVAPESSNRSAYTMRLDRSTSSSQMSVPTFCGLLAPGREKPNPST